MPACAAFYVFSPFFLEPSEPHAALGEQGHIRLGEILCCAVDFSLQRWKKAMHLIYVLQ